MTAMEKCPRCGVELAAPLVAAIKNPLQDESCPKEKTKR